MRCCELLQTLNLKLLFIALVATALFAQSRIVLKSSVINKPLLRLGDIAQIEDSNPHIASFLASLSIDPKFVSDGVISKAEIEKILKQNLIDTKRVNIVGSVVTIKSRAKQIDKAMLLKALEQFVTSRYKNIAIEKIALHFDTLPLQSGSYHLHITPTSQSFHHLYVKITIFDGEKRLRSVNATISLRRFVNAAVATKSIPKGRIIEADDITKQRVRLRSSMQHYLTPSQVVGAVAKRDIRANQIIKAYMVEPDYAVKKRKSVKIVYKKGPIKIELLGLALQNGSLGDIIRVKNISSNKVLRCRVIANGVVQFVY